MPDLCFVKNGLAYFNFRDLSNQPIWIPRRCQLAIGLLEEATMGTLSSQQLHISKSLENVSIDVFEPLYLLNDRKCFGLVMIVELFD